MSGTSSALSAAHARLVDGGFFSWFHFEATDEGARDGDVVYRPSGEAFRRLTALTLQAHTNSVLIGLTLTVARSFLDDPQQSAFARDLIKSFLRALDDPDAPVLASLADEVMFRDPVGLVIARGPTPALPDRPSQAFLTVVGQWRACDIAMAGLTLTFANETVDQQRLAIRVLAA